jgi:hypothetical protein
MGFDHDWKQENSRNMVLFRFEWVKDLTHCKLSVTSGHGGLGDGREAVVRIGVGPDPAVVH